MDLTDTEHKLMQSALENLRVTGLTVWKMAKQHNQKGLGKIAEAILKKHGALETEYGKMITAKARKPRRKKEEMDGQDEWYWGGKETGALRRTSMELTRALAELRRPG